MKVDVLQSTVKRSYALIVPEGTDQTKLTGKAARAVEKLKPLEKTGTHELSKLYHGDLLEHLQAQIAQEGAGLVKVQVQIVTVESIA